MWEVSEKESYFNSRCKKKNNWKTVSRMKDKIEGRNLNDIGKILQLKEDRPIKKTRKENWLFETNKTDYIM